MRIAIFSDVHGNLAALEAVLADIARQSPDATVCAGDLCLAGPRPSACLERVRDACTTCIYGNTDDWLLGRQQPPERLAALARWTHDQLSPEQRDWLDDLPFAHRMAPTGMTADDLLVVHANPHDVNRLIFPAVEEQVRRYGRVRQTDEELLELLGGREPAVMAYGHLHIPGEREVGGWRLINISSVSMPGDGDPRAKYGLFTWEDRAWSLERVWVPYDANAEVAAYKEARPPGWEAIADAMVTEGLYPQRV